jgi:uncharacterized repeat protein (TIGR02543 family)
MITLNGNKTVGATFAQIEYTVTVTAVHGSVTLSDGPYHLGDPVILTATPDTDYTFTGWTVDVRSIENPLTITIDGNKAITANFVEISKFNAQCSVEKLVYDIRQANANALNPDPNSRTIYLDSTSTTTTNCFYTVSTAAEFDKEYGNVGLPVIRADIKLIGKDTGATIKLDSGANFPLFVISDSGSLSLQKVKLGGTSWTGSTGMASVTLKNVAIGKTVTLPEMVTPGLTQ